MVDIPVKELRCEAIVIRFGPSWWRYKSTSSLIDIDDDDDDLDYKGDISLPLVSRVSNLSISISNVLPFLISYPF